MENIKVGDIFVATWGYSMVLTTWVKVAKVSPKTLLVYEIAARSLTEKEYEETGLKTGYLSFYVLPTDHAVTRNGELAPQFRLYRNKGEYVGWHGYPHNFSVRLFFQKWDGTPQHEDHCD